MPMGRDGAADEPRSNGEGGRVLGVDYGEVRVGLSLSDPTGTIALPLDTLKRRRGKRAPVARVARLADEREASAVVVGLPLDLRGEETDWCREIRAFGEALAERTGLPVHYQDERMTSVRAGRALRDSGLRRRHLRDKSLVDRGAAVLILQAWLDAPEATPSDPLLHQDDPDV